MKSRLSIAVLALVLLMSGCGVTSSTATNTSASVPDSVQITRVTLLQPSDRFPPLTATISDAAKARQLYRTVESLPHLKYPAYSCPNDVGWAYQITFYHGGVQMGYDLADATGCRFVQVDKKNVWRQPTDAFWLELANTLGLSQAQLLPNTIPNG